MKDIILTGQYQEYKKIYQLLLGHLYNFSTKAKKVTAYVHCDNECNIYHNNELKTFDLLTSLNYLQTLAELEDKDLTITFKGDKQFENTVKDFYKFLAADEYLQKQMGYKIPATPKQIGNPGSMGIAYDIGNNKVLKITKDKTDAEASASMIGEDNPYVNKYYDVFKYKDKEIYLIISDKLDKYAGMKGIRKEASLTLAAMSFMHYILKRPKDTDIEKIKKILTPEQYNEYKDLIENETDITDNNAKRVKELLVLFAGKKISEDELTAINFIVDSHLALKKEGIIFFDYHGGNIRFDNDNYKIIDLGVSDVIKPHTITTLAQLITNNIINKVNNYKFKVVG